MGLAGSIVGIAAGLGLAKLLTSMFASIGLDLPQTGTSLAARTVIVSLLVGVVVTLVAGLGPALRATRVSAGDGDARGRRAASGAHRPSRDEDRGRRRRPGAGDPGHRAVRPGIDVEPTAGMLAPGALLLFVAWRWCRRGSCRRSRPCWAARPRAFGGVGRACWRAATRCATPAARPPRRRR